MANEIAAALNDFFTEDDWPVAFDTDQGCFVVRFQGRQADWTCAAYALQDDEQAVFYSMAPVRADEAHRLATAEYLTRANSGLILGNFEMDFDDGSIRFKTSVDVEGGELTPGMVRPLVYANVQAMDRYLPGLMAVVSGGASPVEALALVEDDDDDDADEA